MHKRGGGAGFILNIVAGKWTAPVIQHLAGGGKRPFELMHSIEGISRKMLTQTLRQLEEGGLVTRKVFAVVPPRVDYRLTLLGLTLVEPLAVFHRWQQEHGAEIEALEARRKRSASRSKIARKPVASGDEVAGIR